MTSLARRSLLQLSRQSPKLYKSLPITSRRLLSISPLCRQTALETPVVEEVATSGLNDAPVFLEDDITQVDWSRSFHGLSTEPFSEEAAKILTAPLVLDDIEIKPGPYPRLTLHARCRDLMVDGIIYLPEIKYRRILNRAFGPGGWGLAPRSETTVTAKSVSREYALVCHGRLVSLARGEQDYFDPGGIATATEGCKSNALMRCCKDLGVASELWYFPGLSVSFVRMVWRVAAGEFVCDFGTGTNEQGSKIYSEVQEGELCGGFCGTCGY